MFKAPRSNATSDFYDNLIAGEVGRTIWGADSRFAPARIAASPSTRVNYEAVISQICSGAEQALDIGCSTGGFTGVLARYCRSVVGVDLSPKAVSVANRHFASSRLPNCQARVADGCRLDFADEAFDIIQMVDVVHHAEDPEALLREVHRLLKPTGTLIVFEPNKYNVALWLMCLLDRNEWGALKLGSPYRYRKLFSDLFDIEVMNYNGLLIGPDGERSRRLADWLCNSRSSLLRAQSPKIFMRMSRKKS